MTALAIAARRAGRMGDLLSRVRYCAEHGIFDGARAGMDASYSELADALAAKDAEIARLKQALEWYANPAIYKPHPHGPAFDRRDLSFCARAALAGGGEEAK